MCAVSPVTYVFICEAITTIEKTYSSTTSKGLLVPLRDSTLASFPSTSTPLPREMLIWFLPLQISWLELYLSGIAQAPLSVGLLPYSLVTLGSVHL